MGAGKAGGTVEPTLGNAAGIVGKHVLKSGYQANTGARSVLGISESTIGTVSASLPHHTLWGLGRMLYVVFTFPGVRCICRGLLRGVVLHL